MTDYCIIFTTAKDQEQADKITDALLSARLASCVQQNPIKSAYHWKEKIERADEILLLVKTRTELYPAAEKVIKENHSYETPQIVQVSIDGGLPAYLDWVKNEVKE